MRFIAILMSLYLLVLSCIPCCDKDEGVSLSLQTISSTGQQDSHNLPIEACSPFCTCSSCQASAFFQALPIFDCRKIAYLPVKYPQYKASPCIEVSFSIWQPPKIS